MVKVLFVILLFYLDAKVTFFDVIKSFVGYFFLYQKQMTLKTCRFDFYDVLAVAQIAMESFFEQRPFFVA
jgi:hypothetical protein